MSQIDPASVLAGGAELVLLAEEGGFAAPRATAKPPGNDTRRHPYQGGRSLRMTYIAAAFCLACGVGIAMLMDYEAQTITKENALAAPPPAMAPPAQGSNHKRLVYTADQSGHFYIDAAVNGVPIRFMLDTGATFVALSPQDAQSLGLAPERLTFAEKLPASGGTITAARTLLRAIRIDQFEISNVPAAVVDSPMPVSLLGLSFLGRLNGYTVRDGTVTFEW